MSNNVQRTQREKDIVANSRLVRLKCSICDEYITAKHTEHVIIWYPDIVSIDACSNKCAIRYIEDASLKEAQEVV